ncbi:hypothetical protein GGX14DRAFT_576906 [Mycena pura]|uniref:Uncharacterized protein n=1 Tax=Mycena pura TaxID=153505 RepID=A0AAD6UWY0_9AGAR|nr:hypothetical protein GGX14DRAFT_576906 [Mycena pura]
MPPPSPDRRITEPPNRRIAEPAIRRTAEPPRRLLNCQIAEPAIRRTAELPAQPPPALPIAGAPPDFVLRPPAPIPGGTGPATRPAICASSAAPSKQPHSVMPSRETRLRRHGLTYLRTRSYGPSIYIAAGRTPLPPPPPPPPPPPHSIADPMRTFHDARVLVYAHPPAWPSDAHSRGALYVLEVILPDKCTVFKIGHTKRPGKHIMELVKCSQRRWGVFWLIWDWQRLGECVFDDSHGVRPMRARNHRPQIFPIGLAWVAALRALQEKT